MPAGDAPSAAADAPVETVLLDLDGTVWEYHRSAEEVLTASFEAVGVDPVFAAAEYVDRIPKFGDDVETEADLRRRCFVDLGTERGIDAETARAVADAYTRERDYRAVRLLPGAREAIAALGKRHDLAAVTNNGPEAQRPKLDELDLDDAFDEVVCAGALPESKPHSLPFEVALDAVGTAPERAVHVGNSLAADVTGAARAGMRSVYVPDGGRHRVDRGVDLAEPTFRIETLEELIDPPWE